MVISPDSQLPGHPAAVRSGTAFQQQVLVPLSDTGKNAWEHVLAMLEGRRKCEQKQYAKAEVYLGRAMPRDPSNLDLRVEHARALAHLGRYDEALRETRAAQRMFPDSPVVKRMMDWLTSANPAPEP